MNPTQGTATYLQIEFLERKNAELEQQLAELREAAGELVANAEWDGDISAVDTDDLKALRAELLQEREK